jgi:hypothetical protein
MASMASYSQPINTTQIPIGVCPVRVTRFQRVAKSGVKLSILAFQTMPDLPNGPGPRATILDGQASSIKWTCELIHDSQYLRGSMAFH